MTFPSIDLKSLQEKLPLLDDHVSSDLSEIMSKHNSDKGYGLCTNFTEHGLHPPNNVCHNYTYFYEMMFSPYRNNPLTIFEMGVGVPSCMGEGSWAGSLKGWAEYFPYSTIFSADCAEDHLYQDDRITSFLVNQEDENSIVNMWENDKLIPLTFDLIIDDGPHTRNSQFLFYTKSIHKLKTNGIYIIEDVNLDWIEDLSADISTFNTSNNIDYTIETLIIPWPKKYVPWTDNILNYNNLIVIQKNDL
jgi:hypothetical protein